MNTITSANKTRILEGQKQLVTIECLLKSGTTVTLTEANIMENSLVIDRSTSYGDTMFIGSATAAQLSFKIADFNGTYAATDFHDARMDVTLCLNISGTRTSVLPMGRFYVLTAKRNLKTIEITALDQLTLLDAIASRAGAGGYSVTLAKILQNVSSEIFGNTTTIDYSAVSTLCSSPSISAFQYPSGKDVTYHNILAWVAALTGTIARAHGNGGTGSIQLVRNSASGDTITKATRYSGKCEEKDVALTGVFAVDAKGTEYSAGSPGYELNITSNGIFEQAYRQDTGASSQQSLITRLWSNMGALTVRPFKATTLPYPWLECGDSVVYKDDNGTNHTAIITHVRFALNGKMDLSCELPSTEQQSIDTALPPSIKRSTITTEMLRINAIKSLNYSDAVGNFSNAGTWFDLARGLIKSKNFAIDSAGNAYFKGTITATAGYIGTENNGFAIGSNDLTGTYTVGNDSYKIKVETDGTITMRPETFSTNSTYTSTNIDESTLRMSAYHPDIGFHDQIDIYSSQDGMGIGFFVGNNEITDATTAEEFAINGQHRTALGGIYASPDDNQITTTGVWTLSSSTYIDGHSGESLKDWIDSIEAATTTYTGEKGITVSGSKIGHTNTYTAKTTQAVYPIKIDTYGHISAVGSAVTIPTKTSQLTNDSGFLTSVAWTDVGSKPFNSIGDGLESSYNVLQVKYGTGLTTDGNDALAVDTTTVALKTDIPTVPSASTTVTAVATSSSAGSASTYSRGDHAHSISLATGDSNGQVKIAGSNVSVKGLAALAYKSSVFNLVTEGDNRSVATVPNDYKNTFIFKGLKFNTTIGLSTTSTPTYSYLIGLRGWSDSSGGNSHEIAFNNAGVFLRKGASTAWEDWEQIATQSWVTDKGYLTSVSWSDVGSKPFNTIADGAGLTVTNNALGVEVGNGLTFDDDSDAIIVDTSVVALKSDIKTYTGEKGISVSASNAIGHSSTYTAKTTQAVYPIKIDTYGHISAVGSAVTIPTITLNGTATTSPSFYAPTAVGTNGQYLKSTGSGAPTWTNFPTIPTSGGDGITINGTTISVDYGDGLTIDGNDALAVDTNTIATHTWVTNQGYVTTDTKNTAGSTNTSSKIFLIGATSQAANPQTYSHDTCYVGTNGHLYSASKEVLVGGSNAASAVTITPSTTSVYSMSSTGSVTAGTAPSYTRGTFSGGSLSFAMDTTDTRKCKITFTAATHGADSFSAGTTPSVVTLPSRTQVTGLWNGYTAATAAAQAFTGAKS